MNMPRIKNVRKGYLEHKKYRKIFGKFQIFFKLYFFLRHFGKLILWDLSDIFDLLTFSIL